MARLLRSTAVIAGAMLVAAGISGHAQQGASAQGAAATPPRQVPQGADQNPPPPEQPTFRAGVNFVRIDVLVSDRNGIPVTDLKPDDFEILEQKAPQTIETFKFISLDGGLMSSIREPPRQIRSDTDEELEAARDDVRLFAFFLDDYHVRRESSMAMRQQLARFVDTQIGPTDMVGLMYPLQATASVRMTRNHAAISTALQQFMGRKYDYTPKNDIEQRYVYTTSTETVERIRHEVSMSALKALIIQMGNLKEGRKALILVSEGYNLMLPPQMRGAVAAVPDLNNPARNDPFAGGGLAEERAASSAAFSLETDLRLVWDLANKNNVAIYAVDPRGLATNEFGIDQNIGTATDRTYLRSTMETLRTLAINTDGRAIVNRNDLAIGMKQIVQDQSAYYLLGYNSTFTATDGKFHEIKVRVKRPGVQVRHRVGYWAFTAEDAARATEPPKPALPTQYSTALAAVSAPRSRIVRTWVGTARGQGGKTQVTFVWEPVPKLAGAPSRPGDVPSRVSLMAVGLDGSPLFRGRVPATPPPQSTASAGAKTTFDVPPGKVQLRVSVENAENDVLDAETRELDVPDLTGPQVAFGTPSLFRARTLRDLQQQKADAQATPTVAREFSRTERVFVRVPVYGPAGAAPAVTARVLNRAAEPVGDLPVTVSATSPDVREIDLALAPMAPGEYLIEITVAGSGDPVSNVIGFRVTS